MKPFEIPFEDNKNGIKDDVNEDGDVIYPDDDINGGRFPGGEHFPLHDPNPNEKDDLWGTDPEAPVDTDGLEELIEETEGGDTTTDTVDTEPEEPVVDLLQEALPTPTPEPAPRIRDPYATQAARERWKNEREMQTRSVDDMTPELRALMATSEANLARSSSKKPKEDATQG